MRLRLKYIIDNIDGLAVLDPKVWRRFPDFDAEDTIGRKFVQF